MAKQVSLLVSLLQLVGGGTSSIASHASIEGLGFRVQGLVFRVKGLGFRVARNEMMAHLMGNVQAESTARALLPAIFTHLHEGYWLGFRV